MAYPRVVRQIFFPTFFSKCRSSLLFHLIKRPSLELSNNFFFQNVGAVWRIEDWELRLCPRNRIHRRKQNARRSSSGFRQNKNFQTFLRQFFSHLEEVGWSWKLWVVWLRVKTKMLWFDVILYAVKKQKGYITKLVRGGRVLPWCEWR